MKRFIQKILLLILVCCLISGLSPFTLAAGVSQTTGRVNLRTGPSTNSAIIRVVEAGTSVEMLEYAPAGWSKVSVGGTVGYIKSEYLTSPADVVPAVYRTTAGVNFRSGPSTESAIITTIFSGTNVEVTEFNATGWSKVRYNNTLGYIKSEYLAGPVETALPSGGAATGASSGASAAGASTGASSGDTSSAGSAGDPSSAGASSGDTSSAGAATGDPSDSPTTSTPASETPVEQSGKIYRTTGGVNFRTGPSTDNSVIKTLVAGTVVQMLEHDPAGWSKVRVDGTEGYIKSEFLSAGGSGKVELLEWSVAKNIVPKGVPLKVTDVRTGMTFTLRCFSKSGHADVEPLTAADTATILATHNGVWAWDPRPVWVVIDGRTIAASLNGQPHDVSTIKDNNMDGHLCLHFHGTVTNSKSYQKDLNNAVIEAWKAG